MRTVFRIVVWITILSVIWNGQSRDTGRDVAEEIAQLEFGQTIVWE